MRTPGWSNSSWISDSGRRLRLLTLRGRARPHVCALWAPRHAGHAGAAAPSSSLLIVLISLALGAEQCLAVAVLSTGRGELQGNLCAAADSSWDLQKEKWSQLLKRVITVYRAAVLYNFPETLGIQFSLLRYEV
jgi:hypothetical protein